MTIAKSKSIESELVAAEGIDGHVKADLTFRDQAYARPLYEYQVKRITESFRWDLFGRPVLSARKGGTFAILDGAHRIAAAQRKLGADQVVPATILQNLTAVDEAWLFSKLNTVRKQLRPAEVFRADLAAGLDEALDIVKICNARELTIRDVTVGHTSSPRTINAVNVLRRLFRRDVRLLERSLDLLLASWDESDGSLSQHAIVSTHRFLEIYPECDEHRLIRVMGRRRPADLTKAAVVS